MDDNYNNSRIYAFRILEIKLRLNEIVKTVNRELEKQKLLKKEAEILFDKLDHLSKEAKELK